MPGNTHNQTPFSDLKGSATVKARNGGVGEKSKGSWPLDLGLSTFGLSLVCGFLYGMLNHHSKHLQFAFEQAFVSSLNPYKKEIFLAHCFLGLLSLLLLLVDFLKRKEQSNGMGLRRWTSALVLLLVVGSVSGWLYQLSSFFALIHTLFIPVLSIVFAFQVSRVANSSEESFSDISCPRNIQFPSMMWFLDSALLTALVVSVALFFWQLLFRSFYLIEPLDYLTILGLLVGSHVFYAFILAFGVWLVLRLLTAIDSFGQSRWREYNLSLINGITAACAVTLYGFLTVYYSLYYTTTDLWYIPAPIVMGQWGFVGVAIITALTYMPLKKSFVSSHNPTWLQLVLYPFLLPTIMIPLSFRNKQYRGIELRFIVSGGCCLLFILILLYCLYLRAYSYSRILHAVVAQLLLFSVMLFVIQLRAQKSTISQGQTSTVRKSVRIIHLARTGAVVSVLIFLFAGERPFSVAMNRSEMFWGVVKALRGFADIDRDGYAGLFHGGDLNEFAYAESPLVRSPFERDVGEAHKCRQDSLDKKMIQSYSQVKNLLIVTIDALRADSLGCYGYHRPTSPNIDAFAKESVLFTSSYSVSSSTECSFRAFFNGRYSSRRKAKKLNEPPFVHNLITNSTFDVYYSNYTGFFKSNWKTGLYQTMLKNISSIPTFSSFIETLKTLDEKKSFCAWLHGHHTHFPITLPEKGKRFGNTLKDIYDSRVSWADESFGSIVSLLKARNLYDKTMIILSADHGTELWDHGFLYHGPRLYQEVCHVPLIIHVPGVSPSKIETPVSHLDVAPTVIDFFGTRTSGLGYDGSSLLQLMTGKTPDIFISRKLFFISGWGDSWAVLHKGRWKLIYGREDNTWELYDLFKDPKERNNLVGISPQIESILRLSLFDFIGRGNGRYADPHNLRKRLGRTADN